MEIVKPPNLKLKQFILENNLKQKEMAAVLGITQPLFSQKLNENKSKFTLDEVRLLCAYYHLNMHDIFFEENVLKTGQKKEGGC